ncbi:MAG: TRAP transporter substrate-binding protein [Rhodospirillales bacterium]|nr:TRAP transporter substrate-binding protein [Rhodospirillales bacterium]
MIAAMMTRARPLAGLIGLSALLLAGAAALPAKAADPIVMKLATATLNDSQHEWMKRFAAAVERDSQGRIKAELYPASQLGPIPRQIEGTQFGSIQAWIGPPEFLAGVDARYEVLSAPGLFKDLAHANKTLEDKEFRDAFLALGADKGLKGSSLFLSGPAVIVTRKPSPRLADFKGQKIRVLAAPLQMEQIKRLDGTPVPMALGNVLPALQQGAIDGVMSSPPVVTALKFYDSAPNMTETNHAIVSVITVLSKSWFDSLPADLKPMVEKHAWQTGRDVYQWSVDFHNAQRNAWVQSGGKLMSLPPEDQAEMNKRFNGLGDEVVKTQTPEIQKIYGILKAASERAR